MFSRAKIRQFEKQYRRKWTEVHQKKIGHEGRLLRQRKEHSDFYLLLKERGLMHLLLEVYLEKWGPKPDYPNEWAYATAFLSYGTYGWIEEWINRGMQESAETMAELLSKNGMK